MGKNYKYDYLGYAVKLIAPTGESVLLRGEDANSFLDEVYDIEDNFEKIREESLEHSGKNVTIDELLDKAIECYF